MSLLANRLQVQRPANSSQSPASWSQDVEGEGHPPLARTRVPRHQLRYSLKERKGKAIRVEASKGDPKSAKDLSATSDKTDKKNNKAPKTKKLKEASPSAGPAIYADKNKMSLVFSLGRHHHISSLDVGTLDANTKRVFLDNPGAQQEVVECIKESSRLAVDLKREAQRLMGQFLEKFRTRIDAEVTKARGQKKNGERLSVSERLKATWDSLLHGELEILYYPAGNTRPKEEGDEEDIEENQDGVGGGDSEDDESKYTQFLRSFMTYLYSRNPPKATKVGGAVDAFINILAGMDLLNVSHT